MTKTNKALDLNKLFQAQKLGKELKKTIKFPCLVSTKYDGNYVAIRVTRTEVVFLTSGGLTYTHSDDAGEMFKNLPTGVYLGERISGLGKLGDRRFCTLTGPKTSQLSTGHCYKIFDFLDLEEYNSGKASLSCLARHKRLVNSGLPKENIVKQLIVSNQAMLDELLTSTVKEGYEGLVGMDPDWLWEDTLSRKTSFWKYKKRPTVDLICIDVEAGTGKYNGLIGSLILQDKTGRTVSVGSGMSDSDRQKPSNYFIGRVVEVFYEQIIDTYIQPTFGSDYEGVLIRRDKTHEDID